MKRWMACVGLLLAGCGGGLSEGGPLAPSERTEAYVTDSLGSARFSIHTRQEVLSSPFGAPLSQGPWEITERYAGGEDAVFGEAVLFGSRILWIESAQWASPDLSFPTNPEDLHPYQYAQSSPLVIADPQGTCTVCEVVSDVAKGVAGVVYDLSLPGRVQRVVDDTVKSYQNFSEGRVRVYLDPASGRVLGKSVKQPNSISYEHSSPLAQEAFVASTLVEASGGMESKVALPGLASGKPTKVVSSINQDPTMVEIAESMGKNPLAQKAADRLVENMKQGLFSNIKILAGGLAEVRNNTHGGVRIYFRVANRNGENVVDILAKSTKETQHLVINRLSGMFNMTPGQKRK